MPNGRVTDRELPLTAPVAVNGVLRYEHPVYSGYAAFQADFVYTDDYCVSVLCAQTDEIESYVVGNMRASYTTGDEAWTVALFVKNIADTDYKVFTADLSSIGLAIDGYGPPRWVGGSIEYRWQ